ncbi:MAG: hypothetical protein MK089_06325 [Phycisphaerales bacterium]|nr:hypothetical protein [Phycisphaerales bacterium]
MSKMFYTLEEVCQKLGKTPDEITEMIATKQLDEMRDGDNLVFKASVIDMISEPEDANAVDLELDLGASSLGEASDGGMMGLSGSATGMSHDAPAAPISPTSDSGMAFDLSGSASGISAFGGGSEDAGETQLGEEFDDDLTLESVGSGSGLLDLTRDSDDTSLGAELMEEAVFGDDEFELPPNSSGLFESPAEAADAPAAAAAPVAGGAPVMMMEEAYDGGSSGLGVGLLIGATIAMIGLLVILASEFQGASSVLTQAIAGNLWIWTGGLLAGAIIAGGIGLFIGRASE